MKKVLEFKQMEHFKNKTQVFFFEIKQKFKLFEAK